jgi:hypothetical protein
VLEWKMVQMIYALSLIIGALIATMVVWSVFRTEKGLLVGVIWCGVCFDCGDCEAASPSGSAEQGSFH